MFKGLFLVIAKKLDDNGILDALKKLRDGGRRERNQAFADLRDTFDPKLKKLFSTYKNLGDNYQEKQQIKQFIESTFAEVVLSRKLRTDNAAQAKKYISDVMDRRIGKGTVNEFLGKGEIIRDIRKLKYLVNAALKKFIKKHKRQPDFNDKKDSAELAKMIGTTEEKMPDILKSIGPSTIKSMFDSIDGSDSGELLMDTLKSNEPLPDKTYEDKYLMKVLNEVMQKSLSDKEKAVADKWFHPKNSEGETPTKQEIAKSLNMTLKQVKYLIDTAKGKLTRSPALKQLMYSSMVRRFVKYATQKYNKVSLKDSEAIIMGVVNK